jgi:hypothetical protein
MSVQEIYRSQSNIQNTLGINVLTSHSKIYVALEYSRTFLKKEFGI